MAGGAPLLVFLFIIAFEQPSWMFAPEESDDPIAWLNVWLAMLKALVLSLPGMMLLWQIQAEHMRPYLRKYLAWESSRKGSR